MKSQYFKWVPHFLDDNLRPKRLDGARQLLEVLQGQKKCNFRDLITGDETWVSLHMKLATISLSAGAKPPVRVKRTIANEKRMLTVFWGIHGIAHYCWLPKDNTFDFPFFYEEVLSRLAQKMQQNFKQNRQTLGFDSHGRCKGSHDKGNSREIECFPIQMYATATVSPGYCAIRFFLFSWLKTQLEQRYYNREDELHEVVDEILTGISIEMIETVFFDWMNQLQRLIDGNGDCVS
jgi:hypothetical protein